MSTPADIERRAKQVTKRQEREIKRKYEFLAGQVRSQLRKQLDEILKTNTKAFVMLLLSGGALKVGVEAVEKLPEPVIDEAVDTEAAARAIDASDLPNGGAYPGVDAFDQTAYDEIRSGKIPPGLVEPTFPPPIKYIPGEDRFEDEPAAEPPPLLVAT